MQPLSTWKHTRGLSQHGSLPAHRRHLHQLPAYLCLGCLEGHWTVHKGLGLLSRLWLSFFCQRAFPGSLLPTALNPDKSPSCEDFEGCPPCPLTHRSLPILATLSVCQQLSWASHTKSARTAAAYKMPSRSIPPEPYFHHAPHATEVRLP